MSKAMSHAWRRTALCALLIAIAWGFQAGTGTPAVYAAASLELYTPYTALNASPGESITYSIELINHDSETKKADIALDGNANDWSSELTAGGHSVNQIAVKGGESETLSLRLDVPLKIDKGEYRFTVNAGGATLPLSVNITEKGTFTTKLEAEQSNIEGHADDTFTFTTTLRNQTAEDQTYALAASAASGWDVRFSSGGNNVTSVTVSPNQSQTIQVAAVPPDGVKAGTYDIPISASNTNSQAETKLEAVVTGSYGLSLSTSDERLNATVKAGHSTTLEMTVTNSGSVALEDISLSAQTPSDWSVTFEPKTVRSLDPGKTATVQAVIQSDEKALPGDYALAVTAGSAQKSANAAIRVAVKSSSLWGWIGVLIIVAVAGILYGLFRRYGRR
ncbi:NEW3 domain-containing protein [Paenibacillus sp. HB172176]|uniref:COG1470 family protein n=1 Tax=Paenibacillus sp. HB172176 TaxID=2493690 RepID=UPI001F0FA9F8|nr:NEW3 domain-containing protein [Paenibacillus sp. HB172176]